MSVIKSLPKGVFKYLILVSFSACQAAKRSSLHGSTESFSQSVRYLNPELIENQLRMDSEYDGQLILTVEDESVIAQIKNVDEMNAALEEITFLKSNNSFESVVFLLRFKRGVNPIPYYNFLQKQEGVIAAEFDGIVGLADHEIQVDTQDN